IVFLIIFTAVCLTLLLKCDVKSNKKIDNEIKERKEKFNETNKNLNDSTIDALSGGNFIVPKQQ
ncbi:MAG TPA: hypothetical protein PK771_15085, partial [Spirochaetota bacterium]|nr:hypothetical protein [Spirochaetota bacterium]